MTLSGTKVVIKNLYILRQQNCEKLVPYYSDTPTDLTDYSLLPNGLVSMLTYFSLSGADKDIPMFSWTNLFLAVLRLNNRVIFNPTITKHKT
jgi:hypothetical protein